MTLQKLNKRDDENIKYKKEIKQLQNNIFSGEGNKLGGGDSIMERLNREEIRKKRLEALDKDKDEYSIEPTESFKSPQIIKEENEYEAYDEYLKGLMKNATPKAKRQALFPEAKKQGIVGYNIMSTQTLIEQLKKKKLGK